VSALGKRAAEVAGYIALDEPCVGNVLFYYRGNGYRSVDPASVLWWNVVPATRVAAPCRTLDSA
jgi:hypothetical protein